MLNMFPTVITQHGLIVSYKTAKEQYYTFFGPIKYTEKVRQAMVSCKLYVEAIPQIGSTLESEYLKGTIKNVHHKVGLPHSRVNQIAQNGLVRTYHRDFLIPSYQMAKEWYVIELEDEEDRFDRHRNWEDLEKQEWINIHWVGEWVQVNTDFKFKLPR